MDKDLNEYWAIYVEYVNNLWDSLEHKIYLLSNDKCFQEWIDGRKENKMAKKKSTKKFAKKKTIKK